MQFDKIFYSLLFCIGTIACSSTNENKLVVSKGETELKQNEGLVYYSNQPFSGTTVSYYSDSVISETIDYVKGKREGFHKKWFQNGKLSFESNYINGLLNGTSKSWWKNEKLRSKSTFLEGKVNGKQYEYFDSGAKFKETNFEEGIATGMQMAWRRNGKIYNNFEVKNGRVFGLKRSKLCFELEDEKYTFQD